MKAGNNIFYSVLPNLIYKSTISTMPFCNVEDIRPLAPICPYITALHCFGEQLLPPPTLTCLNVMRAGMFLLDSTYLATEVVLGKTAGPNTVSQPHFHREWQKVGHVIQAQPESSSGILQLETKKIRALFSLMTK